MWNLKKKKIQGTDWWLPEAERGRGFEVSKTGEGAQKVRTSSYKINSHGDVMYNSVTTVNDILLYI